jgi:hypothetical protein
MHIRAKQENWTKWIRKYANSVGIGLHPLFSLMQHALRMSPFPALCSPKIWHLIYDQVRRNAVVGISPNYIIHFKLFTEQTSFTTASDTIGDLLIRVIITAYVWLWSAGVHSQDTMWGKRSVSEVLTATKYNEVFSGDQPLRHGMKIRRFGECLHHQELMWWVKSHSQRQSHFAAEGRSVLAFSPSGTHNQILAVVKTVAVLFVVGRPS